MADKEIIPLSEFTSGKYATPNVAERLSDFNDQMVYRLAKERYRRAQLVVSADAVSPQTGNKMRQVLRMYPGVTATGLVSVVDLPDSPESDTIRQLLTLDSIVRDKQVSVKVARQDSPVARAEAGAEPTSDGGVNVIGAIRGTVRNLFDIVDAPVRAIQGGIRSAYGAVSEDNDWGQAALQLAGILPPVAAAGELAGAYGDRPNPWEQTNFGQSIYAALGVPEEGGTLNDTRIGQLPSKIGSEAQGSGWFTDPESDVFKRQRQAVRKAAPLTSTGKGWTLGRGFVDAYSIDPDDTAARFVSGTIDAFSILFMDPLIFAGGAGKVGRGKQALETAREGSEMAKQARGVLAAKKAADQAPERIAELGQVRDELRAARILADARHGQAKWTAIDQTSRINTTRIADVEQQIAEVALERQRAMHAIDLLTREEKILGRSARTKVTAKVADQTSPATVVDEIEEMMAAKAKPAERVQRLTEAFNAGVDPFDVRTEWQQRGLWGRRSSMWKRANEAHDAEQSLRARTALQAQTDEAEQVLSSLTPAEIANGLNDLTRATDLPGTVVHVPPHLPYSGHIENTTTPFTSADDVFPALVDGEPALIRFPAIAADEAVVVGTGQTADVVRTAERADDLIQGTGDVTKAVIPMRNGNSLSFRKGQKPRLDVSDADLERIVASVGKAYDEAGDLVDITDFRVANIEKGAKLSKAKETVPVQGTRALDETPVEKVGITPVAPKAGEGYETTIKVVNGQDTIPNAIWREMLDRLPDAVPPKAKGMLADLAKGNGGPLPWEDVIEFAKEYDALAELADLLMLNGVVGVKGLGRSRAHMWVPDPLGASVTFINKATTPKGVIAPPPVTQAALRKIAYQKKARMAEQTIEAAKKDLDGLRAAQATTGKKSKYLWDAVDEQRRVVQSRADAARKALDAGEDLDVDAVADELALTIKELALGRTYDGQFTPDLSGLASIIDPKRGRLVHPFGKAVDALFRRVGGDGVIQQLAEIDNVATLNRLARGRWNRDFLLAMADAKSTDEVRLLIASMLDITPDTINRLARSRTKTFTGWKGGSAADRVARQMEIVSTRNPLIDLTKPEEGGIYLNQWLRTIGTPQDKADEWVSAFIKAADEPERADVLMHTVADGLRDDLLVKANVQLDTPKGQHIQKATRIFGEHFKESAAWFQERIANGASVNGGLVNGEWVEFGGPHLLMELADSTIRLPDVVELRRFNTAFGRRLQGSATEAGFAAHAADWANRVNDMWRTWLLVRGAYVVRNIMETQMRAYVLGSHNALTNPLMFLGMMVSGADTKTARALRPFTEKMNKYNSLGPGVDMSFFQRQFLDPADLDESGRFADNAVRLFNEDVHGGVAPQDFRAVQATVSGYKPELVRNGKPHFNTAHARELLVLRSDPLARIVAGNYPATVETAIRKGAPVEDAILDWLYRSPDGKAIISTRHATAPKRARDMSAWKDREWVRGYLFDWPGSVRSRLSMATGDDPRLMGYLTSGRLTDDAGQTIYSWDPVRKQRELAKASSPRKLADDVTENEEYVLARAVTQTGARASLPDDAAFTALLRESKDKMWAGRAVDWFFRWSGDLERLAAWNPEFRITFTKHSLRYLDSMHPDDAIKWLDAVTPSMPKMRALKDMPGTKLVGGRVDFSDLYKHQRARLAKGVDPDEAFLTIDDMKSIAGSVASEHNKSMFYAALNQQNFWHAARFAIPFGQPTVNAYRVFSRSLLDWTNLVTRHYPAMRAFSEAQSEGSAVINEALAALEPGDGLPEGNRPFLFREQEDGPLKFRYPIIGSVLGMGADWLTAGDSGFANQEMTGFVSGLNLALQGVQPMPENLSGGEQAAFLFSNAFPTVGWTMQTAASWTGLDEQYGPGWDQLNQWIFPFQRPTDDAGEWWVNFLPTWAKRLVLGALGTGETAAKWRAANMRGVMGYHATRNTGTDWTTPQGKEDMLARSDRDARILSALQALGAFWLPTAPQWSYEAMDEDGTVYAQSFIADEWRQIYDRTDDWDQAVLEFMDRFGENIAMVITPSTEGEPTLSEGAWDALLENDQLKAYRQVLPLFFPGDISWVAYEWQKQHGYRKNLSPEERIENGYRLVYEMQRAKLEQDYMLEGWSDEQYEIERGKLDERWPAGRPKGTGQYKTSREQLQAAVAAINQVPYLAATEVGKATSQAMERYDYYVELGGNKTLTGSTVAEERAAFREEVDWLFASVPGGSAMARLFYKATEGTD